MPTGLAALTAARPLVVIGGGKMGSALMTGWLESGLDPAALVVIDPSDQTRQYWSSRGAAVAPDLQSLSTDREAAVFLLAVKPQIMPRILPDLRARGRHGRPLFLSIAAGRPLGFFEQALGPDAAIVRAMPNTPALIGLGATVACANSRVTPSQRDLAAVLMQAAGIFEWVDDENILDIVTSLSGSGPAYVFLLTEALTQAGVALGLPADLSDRLARATVIGSGALLQAASEPPSILRQNVTSPGGTTERALAVLMSDNQLAALILKAVAAGAARSRELANI